MHYNMVKRASRAYLEEIANRAHEMPEVYKCINTLQETAFEHIGSLSIAAGPEAVMPGSCAQCACTFTS